MKKISELFQIDEKTMAKKLINKFNPEQNWIEKMAGQDRKEGIIIDETIYNSHHGNEEFYAKVSKMITEKINNKELLEVKDNPPKNPVLSFIYKFLDRFKNIIKTKDVKMLPETTSTNKRNDFSENLKVSVEALNANSKMQETKNIHTKQQEKEDHPRLDD